MTSTAPSPPTLNGEAHGRSQPSPSFARLPHVNHVVTSVPVPLTITPASARSNPSIATSPTNNSLQSSPEGPRGRDLPQNAALPAPLELPESNMAIPANLKGTAPSDAVIVNNKCPGLMRRISRGAANRLTRRRQSSSNQDKRDLSSGPVIMRRRSDSKSGGTSGKDTTDLSYGEEDEESLADSLGIFGLGDGASFTSEPRSPVGRDAVGVAPIVPLLLQAGTTLTKVTKKKLKLRKFSLDLDTAKVYWDPSNPAKKFYIDDIKEIRTGANIRNYREEYKVPDDAQNRWFTILYADPERTKGRQIKTMHLIAENEYIFELWTQTLDDISRYRIELMAGLAGSTQSETILRAHWQREMTKLFSSGPHVGDQENLDLQAVENLCRSLHINCSKNMLRAQFAKADSQHSGRLNFNEFKDFVRRLKERKDIKDIFKGIASDSNEGLTLDEFLLFLNQSQGLTTQANSGHWVSTFEKFARKPKQKSQVQSDLSSSQVARMNLDAFSSFLVSSYNGVHFMEPLETKFDRPLNEYFISSSHNTYLLGRQVAGESSTEAYISALQRGCRCVEIDCWDGPDGRPIVSHGRTMTSSVLFADCISVIGRYAFLSSDYPLILSLEVHCNPEQQLAMVKMMKEDKKLKESLLLEPLLLNSPKLPSPEELKHRILVKVKTADDPNEGRWLSETSDVGRKRSASSPFARPTVLDSPITTLPPLSSPPSMSPSDSAGPVWSPGKRSMTTASMSSATEDSDTPQSLTASAKREKRSRQKSRIVPALADLGVYTRGLKWNNFTSAESKRYNHVFSFAERGVDSICKDAQTKAQLEKHNVRYLSRVYPSGYRLKSSNFDPNKFWRRGVQMVALNWQTYDIGMQMNQAMFAAGSDRTGYVLKPENMRHLTQSAALSTDMNSRPKMDKRLVRFSVDMISAQQLPRPRGMGPEDNINSYIEIEMWSAEDKSKGVAFGEGGMDASARNGMSGIGLPHRRRTKIEQNNGYNPIFNDQFKLSLETKYPDLVFVRWVVWNSTDGQNYNKNNTVPLATFTAKLSSLQQGYRHLPLFDGSGDQFLFSTLFCKITKEDSVTVPATELDELRAERVGIFRQIGQTVFKRTLSVEREKEKEKEKEKERKSSLEERRDSKDVLLEGRSRKHSDW